MRTAQPGLAALEHAPRPTRRGSARRLVLASGALLASTLLAGCSPLANAGPGCRPTATAVPLPEELRESSGVAVSLRHPGVLWTHNDAGSVLYAVDAEGGLLARYPLSIHLRDWEDLALAMCGEGDSCLYAADLGDNYEERTDVKIVRIREPDPGVAEGGAGAARAGGGRGGGPGAAADPLPGDTLGGDVFPVRLPDGSRDIEALLVLPGERVMAVTKGRNHAVTVYRYPPPLRPDTVTLEEVQRLSEGARFLPRQVTGGAVAPEGGIVVLRTYESLTFYQVLGDTFSPLVDGQVSLRTLQEAQGEGVGMGLDGTVVLTSEGGPAGGPAGLNVMRCGVGGQ